MSILVAEPTKTKINIAKELERTKLKDIMPPIPSKLFQAPQVCEIKSTDVLIAF